TKRCASVLLFVMIGLAASQAAAWEDYRFSPTKLIANGYTGAASAYAADLDGDGDLDVLGAANSLDRIDWWENVLGDGSVWTSYYVTLLDGARGARAADVDGDGDLDILAAGQNANQVVWWENRRGESSDWKDHWTGHVVDSAFEEAMAVFGADLDGDGDMDIVGAGYTSNKIAWWENDGTPADGGWTIHTVDAAFNGADDVYVVDLDEDGDLDILGAGYLADKVTWWENDGTPVDGGWTTHTLDDAFDETTSVHAEDMNGDGYLDILAVSRYGGDTAWWENDGTPGDGDIWTKHVIANFPISTGVFASDLDGDGDADVLITTSDNGVMWCENRNGAGTEWLCFVMDASLSQATSPFVADIDGDGHQDLLAAANASHVIAWWRNETASPLWEEVSIGSAIGGGISNTGTMDPQGTSMAIGSDQKPKVCWNTDGYGGYVYVRGFNGSSWEEIGGGSASGTGIVGGVPLSLEVSPDGLIYEGGYDSGGWQQTMRYSGSAWEPLSGLPSGGGAACS
ncbi:MAG: VCBS repeat-containing protein, partial [Chloroflexi bacterium]|nr:VCBS repeat-containing protein [Chloroflexota bacterium]